MYSRSGNGVCNTVFSSSWVDQGRACAGALARVACPCCVSMRVCIARPGTSCCVLVCCVQLCAQVLCAVFRCVLVCCVCSCCAVCLEVRALCAAVHVGACAPAVLCAGTCAAGACLCAAVCRCVLCEGACAAVCACVCTCRCVCSCVCRCVLVCSCCADTGVCACFGSICSHIRVCVCAVCLYRACARVQSYHGAHHNTQAHYPRTLLPSIHSRCLTRCFSLTTASRPKPCLLHPHTSHRSVCVRICSTRV